MESLVRLGRRTSRPVGGAAPEPSRASLAPYPEADGQHRIVATTGTGAKCGACPQAVWGSACRCEGCSQCFHASCVALTTCAGSGTGATLTFREFEERLPPTPTYQTQPPADADTPPVVPRKRTQSAAAITGLSDVPPPRPPRPTGTVEGTGEGGSSTRSRPQPQAGGVELELDWDPNLPSIILDNGSGRLKAGFSNEAAPSCVFPSMVGRLRYRPALGTASTGKLQERYVGDQAQTKRGILALNYPIEHGIVVNWDDMEAVWQYAFDSHLRVDPTSQPLLLTEAPLNPIMNRAKMVEVMFERFQVPGIQVAVQALLALMGTGRLDGMVVDVGDGVTHTAPVAGGHLLKHAVKRQNLAGRDLTDYLIWLLMQKGYYFTTTAERELVRTMKEEVCMVALDFQDEYTAIKAKPDENMVAFELPDGQVVRVEEEQVMCPELLFQPHMWGRELKGLHELVQTSVQDCASDLRRTLYGNVLLSGGTTTFDFLDARLRSELEAMVPGNTRVRVSAPDDRQYLVWKGAAWLAAQDVFLPSWVSRREYEERGPDAMAAKAFYVG